MDDLNGLDWSASSSANAAKAPTGRGTGTGNYYPSLRPTPPPQLSGRNTPLSAQGSGAPKQPPSKSATPDSFSNLVSFGSTKQNTLSLQEQQAKLLAERRKQEEAKKRQYEAQFGSSQAWDGLGSRTSTPPVTSRSATPAANPLPATFASTSSAATNGTPSNGGDDDLFAAFNKDTKVDNASFYPPPSSGTSTPGAGVNRVNNLSQPSAWEQPAGSSGNDQFGDDDDPFGLGQMKPATSAPAPITSSADDDDFLGDLGKPVEEVRRPSPAIKESAPEPESELESADPWDKAVADLVDMGFSAEQSRRALTESGGGLDVQAAVSWILNDAHRQAKQKQQGRDPSRSNGVSNAEQRDGSRGGSRREDTPAWMREEGRDRSQPRIEDNRPSGAETDLSKTAAAVGSNLLKSANSLWKTSKKNVQKAVADFQQDSDTSQPKWMREAAEREQEERRAAAAGRRRPEKAATPDVTDEALALESGSRPPPRKAKAPEPRFAPSSTPPRDESPSMPRPPVQKAATPRWQQQANLSDPRSRISKQTVEEQSAQAYVSPARRKKATPQPQPSPEPDLLFSSSNASQPKSTPSRSTPTPSKPPTTIPTRPKAPPRNIPSVSPTALQSSHQHRQAGTAHFKRGDYASAHQSYSASLLSLPSGHPITIILLCNRALTSLKTGIPKQAVTDADTALELVGPSQGHGETIDLGPSEKKEMREFFGKALTRKAEALEQMEKWKEAGDVWKLSVENSVGGATAIQGRTRCEKALAPKKPAAPRPTAAAKPKPRPSAMADLNGSANSAAVERLRKANQDAERADDERFALSEKVEARIGAWRDGKRDNLRALLGSLENVMWEGSNWKKIGMHELVQNNKVKVQYMKAIGKCHPDKLPQDASTETQMLAALIFATLNESWDKFKAQNGM